MLGKLLNQENRATRQRQRLSVLPPPYLPTNEDRLLAWYDRLARHNQALLNGRPVSFPLPVTKA